MPDRPQSTVVEPSDAFRETFLARIEVSAHHRTVRDFGELLGNLVSEAHLVVMEHETRRTGRKPGNSWTTQYTRAVLLDLASIRGEMQGIFESMGEESTEDTRLSLAVSDLIPTLDAFAAKIRDAYHVAAPAAVLPKWPTYKMAPGAPPSTDDED